MSFGGGASVAGLRGTGLLPQVGVGTTGDTNNRLEMDADGGLRFGPGNAAVDTVVSRGGAGQVNFGGNVVTSGSVQINSGGLGITAGVLDIKTPGNGLMVAEGANAKQGVATLVAGSVVVNTTAVTANSRIAVNCQTLGTVTVASTFDTTTRTVGTSFTIHASQATDTSVVFWEIFEPG